MKKITFTLIAIVLSLTVYAQKVLPEIKSGTTIMSIAIVQGQQIPLFLTINSITDGISLGWAVEGYGDGSFKMSAKAVENGNKMFMTTQPALGETKLADDETFGFISRSSFKSLSESKSFNYNGIKFKLKTSTSTVPKINGKEADAINVVSEDGKYEFWVLNNPSLPLIIQSSGLTPDIIISEIK